MFSPQHCGSLINSPKPTDDFWETQASLNVNCSLVGR